MPAGIYALRHKSSGVVYIGSSKNLKDRRKKWRHTLNTKFTHLPHMREHLSSDANDWDFHVLYEIPVIDPEVLLRYENYAVEYLRQTAPDRCLNWYPATRLDVNLLTVGTRTQSLRAWMRETGIARSTLAFRFHQGWPPEAIIGRASPPTADLVNFTTTSTVLVVAGKQVLTRREAAAQLGCKPETLTKRLRKYRIPGQQVRVHLYELKLGIRPLAERL